MEPQNIENATPPFRFYLIGFMGSGKSFVGRNISERLNLNFQDLDDSIVSKANMTIPEIFKKSGEPYFRQLEKECLNETQMLQNSIIATGGGAPCFYDNMNWMNQNGVTIFLDVATPILVERLRKEMISRPLIASKTEAELSNFIDQKLEERKKFYDQAHLIYHVQTGKEPILLEFERFFERMSF